MELLTIGAFARLARLSPKALRLYDELGLLTPADVDAWSGYRFYRPDQLERARLILWLRRLGMPLARIRTVCDLPAAEAAEQIRAYWAQVVADTAARGQLATFLVDHLSGRGTTMSDPGTPLGIRYAARSDQGPVRTSNEDVAYAGSRLLAVADGVRGPAGGLASTAAVEALKSLEEQELSVDGLLDALADAVGAANRAVGEVAGSGASGQAVTTLTALLWSGSRLALAHIGDGRVYVLRDGELFRITHDHTIAQRLVDEGKLTQEEARSHPQRMLLLRALTGSGTDRPDLSLHDVRAGDRYLICSDGLFSLVPDATLRAELARDAGPEEVLDALVGLAYAAGAPDNIACVVADVVAL